MERVLRNTAATVSVTFYNGSTPVDADTDPTVVVKRADGSTLLSTTATNEIDPGVYSVVIPPQTNLNVLTITWTGEFTGTDVSIESIVEIVGGFYFSIAELRGADPNFANLSKYPTSALVDARMQTEAEFEDITGRAFVPRYYREESIVSDEDTEMLWLEKPDPIRFITFTINGVSYIHWYDSGYIMKDKYSPRGLVLRSDALGVFSYDPTYYPINAEYEYGMTKVPIPIKEKAIKRAKMKLLGAKSTIDERALTMTLPDIGTVNLATPGVRGSETGVPDIDVVLSRYRLDGGAGVF